VSVVRGFLLGSVFSAALYGPAAGGDDLPRFDWSGIYAGGHVACGRGHVSNTLFDPDPSGSRNTFATSLAVSRSATTMSSPRGCCWASKGFPNFLEDGFISSRTTAQGISVTDEINTIGTLRGRFGYAFDHWMIYATSGFAWSKARMLEMPGVINDEDKVLPAGIGTVATYCIATRTRSQTGHGGS
jgi:hypothetical protein